MRRRRHGFTLVELMIVVAILGVLASLAVYGVSRYLIRAKTAEATRSLGSIENGERSQYQIETAWPPGTTDSYRHVFCPNAIAVPTIIPKAMKVSVAPSVWQQEGWACLKFTLGDPQYYQYEVISNGLTGTAAIYTASARGDLNGNDVFSHFELVGRGGLVGDAVRDTFRSIRTDE